MLCVCTWQTTDNVLPKDTILTNVKFSGTTSSLEKSNMYAHHHTNAIDIESFAKHDHPNNEDKRETCKDRRRRYQHNHRLKKQKNIDELLASIEQLKQANHTLECQVQNLSHSLESSQCDAHSNVYLVISRCYWLFQAGLSDDLNSVLHHRQEACLQNYIHHNLEIINTARVSGKVVHHGIAEIRTQLSLYREYFDSVYVEITAMSIDNYPKVIAVVQEDLNFQINYQTLRHVFPHPKINQEKVLGKILKVQGRRMYEFQDGKISRLSCEMTFLHAWTELLGGDVKLAAEVMLSARIRSSWLLLRVDEIP